MCYSTGGMSEGQETEFGPALRAGRLAAGLSQRELAARTALDFSYISKVENGRLPLILRGRGCRPMAALPGIAPAIHPRSAQVTPVAGAAPYRHHTSRRHDGRNEMARITTILALILATLLVLLGAQNTGDVPL